MTFKCSFLQLKIPEKIFPIEKSLGNDEENIKSVWETKGNEPSPPKQRSRAEHGFFVLIGRDLKGEQKQSGGLFLPPQVCETKEARVRWNRTASDGVRKKSLLLRHKIPHGILRKSLNLNDSGIFSFLL